ncbi:uncharacterized protein LOC143458641 [Clavelina lepadiformis]|uniref:uncharacterized protein LOC143458641 n=1 Tax=Clavelina lepadiformis TaxID=159417 RepID=UPI00404215CC
MVENLKDPVPLSHFMKYAITRNKIEEKGEHQKKLKVIRQDHRRKEGEIGQSRSQAARDHVLYTYNASFHSHNSRPLMRTSVPRDRESMARIQDMSNIYLLQVAAERHNASRVFRKKLLLSKSYPPPLMPSHDSTTKNIFLNSLQVLSTAKQRLTSVEVNEVEKRKIRRSASLQTFKNLYLRDETQQTPHELYHSANTEKDLALSNIDEQEKKKVRPMTSEATYPIRRRSCQFSISAKSLIHLQRIQQESRMKVTTRPRHSLPSMSTIARLSQSEVDIAIKNNSQDPEKKTNVENKEKQYKVYNRSKHTTQNSKRLDERTHSKLVQEIKVEDVQQQSNKSPQESKVERHKNEKENKNLDVAQAVQKEEITRKPNTEISKPTTKKNKPVLVPDLRSKSDQKRKRSVHWSDTVPPDKHG